MAHGISDPECKKEYFDSQIELNAKLDQLAQWIKESQHFIVFTGAGVSTSTGIPDFRSAMDTILPTGPGEWELQDNKKFRSNKAKIIDDIQQAIPSPSHMALVELQRRGILKCLISQNCDGLHLRSGMNPAYVAELHGNMNLETCEKCHAKYLRDFDTDMNRSDHYTDRQCDKPDCRGRLKDSLINFGENLPEDELNKAFNHAEKADVCLVLGSSLTVTPASDIPRRVAKRKKKLIIGNLQRTPLYNRAIMNIHTFSDTIMKGLMERLNIPIPPWILRRRVRIICQNDPDMNKSKINIEGRDPDNAEIPFTLFKSIQMTIGDRKIQELNYEPFSIEISNKNIHSICIRLHFFGHYNEVPFDLHYINIRNVPKEEQFYLFYNPLKGEWRKTIDETDLPI
ncbi:unnamed protein product [Adineta steineri]|uniref:protein acetyllysine N-acetyltransferase n=1 Tax=Adineta steineri TaxID=433720 RepID=A0A815NG54_9BILA|nr:unnamed protein product [Adineta steineri]CAF4007512.1 unnamed protein product [Adineta steineri]